MHLILDDNECADPITNGVDCHSNATCVDNSTGTYSCECNEGYVGNGTECFGKYTSASLAGNFFIGLILWERQQLLNTRPFIHSFNADADECETDADDCDTSATCTNTLGSFTCACNHGYSGDGFTCTGKSYTGFMCTQ